MSRLTEYAKRELEILSNTIPYNDISEFEQPILSMCEAFSEQSGGSAPFYAELITSILKKLLLFTPLTPIVGTDDEWIQCDFGDGDIYQNSRCTALFKRGEKCSYNNAIVWRGEDKYDTFSGTVYLQSDAETLEMVSSSVWVKLPFTPKTFYIDVARVYTTIEYIQEMGITYLCDANDNPYYYVIKDPTQLKDVYSYFQ